MGNIKIDNQASTPRVASLIIPPLIELARLPMKNMAGMAKNNPNNPPTSPKIPMRLAYCWAI